MNFCDEYDDRNESCECCEDTPKDSKCVSCQLAFNDGIGGIIDTCWSCIEKDCEAIGLLSFKPKESLWKKLFRKFYNK
jgi:hypothetical protein